LIFFLFICIFGSGEGLFRCVRRINHLFIYDMTYESNPFTWQCFCMLYFLFSTKSFTHSDIVISTPFPCLY
jgi:hypothetical protein